MKVQLKVTVNVDGKCPTKVAQELAKKAVYTVLNNNVLHHGAADRIDTIVTLEVVSIIRRPKRNPRIVQG